MGSVMENIAEETESEEEENHAPGIDKSEQVGEPQSGCSLRGQTALAGVPGVSRSGSLATVAPLGHHMGVRSCRAWMDVGQMHMLGKAMRTGRCVGSKAASMVGQAVPQTP